MKLRMNFKTNLIIFGVNTALAGYSLSQWLMVITTTKDVSMFWHIGIMLGNTVIAVANYKLIIAFMDYAAEAHKILNNISNLTDEGGDNDETI